MKHVNSIPVEVPIIEATASEKEKAFFQQSITGKRYLLNFFASWCQPCQVEHPLLMKLAKEHHATIVGIAWHDIRINTQNYIKSSGNPYSSIIDDFSGSNGINYGIKGIPETFLIDEQGNVLYHLDGPITEDVMNKILIPKL